MKTIKLMFKIGVGLILLVMCAIAIEPSVLNLAPHWIAQLFSDGGFTSFAGVVAPTAAAQAVKQTVTTVETKAASVNLLRPEISNVISKVRPDVFPLDTILREVGNVGKCDSREYKFYSTTVRGVSDLLTAAHTQADTQTSQINVTNIQIWLPDDIGIFPEITVGTAEFRFKVVAVDNPNSKITIRAINGVGAGGAGTGDFVPAIDDASVLVRIGNAKAEIDAQNTPYANMPTDTYNYVQIFMCQVEESLVNFQHNKEVEFNINDYQTDAIYDMRRMAELTMLFGYPKQDVLDPVAGKKVDVMGGARHYITKTITYDHAVAGTNAVFNTWGKTVFTGNNGSYTRMLFAGNGLVEWMMNVPVVEKQLQASKTEIVAGIKFKVLDTYFGDIYLRRHQSFDDLGGSWSYNGIVFDVANLERRYRRPTETTELDLDRTGQRRVTAYRILEEWTMAFRNPETHAWIETSS